MGDYSNQNISAKQAGYKDAYASSLDPSQELKDQEDKVTKALKDYQADIDAVKTDRALLSKEAKELQDQLGSDKDGKIAAKILGIFLLQMNSFETADQLAPTFGRVDVSNQFLALQNLVTKQFGQSMNLSSLSGFDFGALGKAGNPPAFDANGNLKVTLPDGTASSISPQQLSDYSIQHGVFFKLSDLGLVFSGNPMAGTLKAISPSDPGAMAFANNYISGAHETYQLNLISTCNSVSQWLNGVDKNNPYFQENPDLLTGSLSTFLSQAISSNDPISAQEAQSLVFEKGSQDSVASCQQWTTQTSSSMSEATGSLNSINQRAATMAQTEENMAKGFLDASKNIVQQSLQMLQKITDNMPK
jgi:hypothetical protein